MRIGFDAKRAYCNNTGLGNYSRDTIRLLAQYYPSNEYHLYTPKLTHNKRLNFISHYNQIRVHSPQHFLNKQFSSLWRTVFLSKYIQTSNLDIFHGLSHELPLNIHQSKIKTVVSIHDLIAIRFPQFFNAFDRFSYVKKSRYACRVADKIIAVSQQTKEDIIRFFGINEQKVEVIYQGCNSVFQHDIPTSELERIKNKFKLPKKYLLYVGTIEERKNLLTLLKCLNELPDYNLVVIGTGKEYMTKCLKYIDSNNIQNRVTFLSQLTLNDMAGIYRQANMMIYPSFFEGFGIPILESLFSGIPVITTKGGCFAEAGGPFSSYINPTDTEQLKQEILDISTNTNRRKKMITEGKKYANNFTDEKIASRILSLYQSIL